MLTFCSFSVVPFFSAKKPLRLLGVGGRGETWVECRLKDFMQTHNPMAARLLPVRSFLCGLVQWADHHQSVCCNGVQFHATPTHNGSISVGHTFTQAHQPERVGDTNQSITMISQGCLAYPHFWNSNLWREGITRMPSCLRVCVGGEGELMCHDDKICNCNARRRLRVFYTVGILVWVSGAG